MTSLEHRENAMLTEPLPISIFVRTRFSDPNITAITDKWRVEGTIIETIVISHFEDMGLFSVNPSMEKDCFNTLMHFLYNSPEIYAIVKKAEAEELRRKQSRHLDN